MTVVLDVAIGIIFLYLLLALLVTTLQELIASWFDLRADNLYRAIEGMLQAPPTAKDETEAARQAREKLFGDFYNHPLIKNLRAAAAGKLRKPSYIPSRTFAIALLDALRSRGSVDDGGSNLGLLEGARGAIANLPHPDLQRAFHLFFENAGLAAARARAKAENEANLAIDELELVQREVEAWFNDRMSRASGWYKRKAQSIALGLAFGITLVLNADSIHVATSLWTNGALREQIAANAASYYAANARPAPVAPVKIPAPAPSESSATELTSAGATNGRSEVPVSAGASGSEPSSAAGSKLTPPSANDLAQFPIGWGQESWDEICLGSKLFGLVITALAVSLGAGFWFDVLGKALQIRGTGPRVSVETGRVES